MEITQHAHKVFAVCVKTFAKCAKQLFNARQSLLVLEFVLRNTVLKQATFHYLLIRK